MPILDGATGPAGRAVARAAARELARLRRVRGPGRRTARRIERARFALAVGLLATGLPDAARARTPIFVNPLLPFGLTNLGTYSSADFADLDGDGDLDALIGDNNGELRYFTNIGTKASPAFTGPTFNAFALMPIDDLTRPVFADIDGDADLDVFVGGANGQTIFYQNLGSASAPTFAPPTVFGFGDVGLHACPAFADLDSDGDLDAFISENAGNTLYFENTGSATAPAFAAAMANPFGLADAGTDVAPRFGDLDGDGDLDALMGNVLGRFLYFANTGTVQEPAFAPAVTNPFGLGAVGGGATPAFADLDADGDLDVVSGAPSDNVVLFSNVGTKQSPAFLGPVAVPEVEGRASPTFGDIDGDGDLDALVGFSLADGGEMLFRNTGTASVPAFAAGELNPAGLVNPTYGDPAPDLADLDGDGDLDALVGSQLGTISFENTGSALLPAFAAPVENPPGLAKRFSTSPTLADLDADGDLDAIVGNIGGEILYLANTGTAQAPAFSAPTTSPFGLPVLDADSRPSFADVDGDGDLDFLGGESSGTLTFEENRGTRNEPVFGFGVTGLFGLFNVGVSTEPAFADVDDDGDPDVFVGDNLGRIQFFANLTPACPAVPEPVCGSFETGSLSVDERKPGQEKLTVKLARGPALAQARFGDPAASDGADVALCVYDGTGARVAALSVRRAGEACGAKPCWKPLGGPSPDGKGFAYKDPTGEADGVRTVRLAGGSEGRTSVAVAASNRAKKGERAMTTGIAAALASASEVIVQVHAGACHEVRLTEITKQELDRFKAR